MLPLFGNQNYNTVFLLRTYSIRAAVNNSDWLIEVT